MKRLISILLVLLLLCSFAACDTGSTPVADTEETTTAPSATEKDTNDDTPAPCTHVYNAIVTPPTAHAQGYTTHTCTLCGEAYVDTYVDKLTSFRIQYDDYIPSFGSISATSETVTLEGDALEIVTKNNVKYFHAKGVGEVTMTDGDQTQVIIIDKAKINLVVVMGQSNSVAWEIDLFKDALSDISAPLGTAYRWSHRTTQPINYTTPTRGIHSTLLAELYAQSVAAGDPVKNVLIWENNITSTSGQSITGWATPSETTQDTKDTATMIKNCKKYYTDRSDLYEIVSIGMYWLQGEIDGSTDTDNHDPMDPPTYEACFMKMWRSLKSAGLEYVAFLRVRGDVADNMHPNADAPDHNDIDYNTALAAQLKMIAENDNFYLATAITENWVGTADTEHTIDIQNYYSLMEKYSGGTRFEDEFGNVATYADGKLTTTMKSIYGSINYCHYGKFGYTLLGADAAYNMYRALHGKKVAIVQGDTSGAPAKQTVATAGEQKVITVTSMWENITFHADTGSMAGKLSITVKSGENDATSQVRINEGAHLGALSTAHLLNLENVLITVTYTTTDGTVATVTYTLNNQIA
ncbi:MAG: hypothetical protein J6Q82_00790 [Clostridia bacterium]|nr:hypothetical protein [Clostridia bacterium]